MKLTVEDHAALVLEGKTVRITLDGQPVDLADVVEVDDEDGTVTFACRDAATGRWLVDRDAPGDPPLLRIQRGTVEIRVIEPLSVSVVDQLKASDVR